LGIREEIEEVLSGKYPVDNNLLVNAPHPAHMLTDAEWDTKYPYSRDRAAYPLPYVREAKFWPTTRRVDNVHGDRVLVTKLQTSGSLKSLKEMGKQYSPH
jgi:glycine dehydrogenase